MKEAATTRMRLCIQPVPHTCACARGQRVGAGAGWCRPRQQQPALRLQHAACRAAPPASATRATGKPQTSQAPPHLAHGGVHQRVPGAALAPRLEQALVKAPGHGAQVLQQRALVGEGEVEGEVARVPRSMGGWVGWSGVKVGQVEGAVLVGAAAGEAGERAGALHTQAGGSSAACRLAARAGAAQQAGGPRAGQRSLAVAQLAQEVGHAGAGAAAAGARPLGLCRLGGGVHGAGRQLAIVDVGAKARGAGAVHLAAGEGEEASSRRGRETRKARARRRRRPASSLAGCRRCSGSCTARPALLHGTAVPAAPAPSPPWPAPCRTRAGGRPAQSRRAGAAHPPTRGATAASRVRRRGAAGQARSGQSGQGGAARRGRRSRRGRCSCSLDPNPPSAPQPSPAQPSPAQPGSSRGTPAGRWTAPPQPTSRPAP